ncbi:MAG: sec-independent protein translocase protein TatC, partial [Limisphaerales bacterium]
MANKSLFKKKTKGADALNKVRNKEMSFVDHLEELRWHLVRGVSAIFIFGIAAFIAKPLVFDYLIFAPKHPDFLSYRALCWLSESFNLGSS